MSSKEEIRQRRLLKSGNVIQEIPQNVAEDIHTFLALIKPTECPQCHESLPKVFFSNVRGQILCFRCQFDRIHDFMEENRRRIKKRR